MYGTGQKRSANKNHQSAKRLGLTHDQQVQDASASQSRHTFRLLPSYSRYTSSSSSILLEQRNTRTHLPFTPHVLLLCDRLRPEYPTHHHSISFFCPSGRTGWNSLRAASWPDRSRRCRRHANLGRSVAPRRPRLRRLPLAGSGDRRGRRLRARGRSGVRVPDAGSRGGRRAP